MKPLLTFIATLLIWTSAVAGSVNTQGNGNTAIQGYDPVAYFTDSKPIRGSNQFSYSWQGSSWHFSSAANRDSFIANPDAYAPQYGGYCAYAVASGYTAPIDPNAWRVVDAKLYLNYSKSVQKRWVKDIPGYIERGDKNWPEIKAGL